MTQREGYEAWFRASYGQEPIPRTSPAHDFCWAGYKAGASSRDAEVAELVAAIQFHLKSEGDYDLIKADKMMSEALTKAKKP